MLRTKILLIVCLGASLAGCAPDGNDRSARLRARLAPYLAPSESYRDVYGDYCSPLLFYNGDTVRNAAEWQLRRAEIRRRWMSLMGEWPPVMTGQRLEFRDTLRREGFTQYGVGFSWLPGQRTEGYLLVPDGDGPKPAVVTVYYEPETAAGLNDKQNRDFARQLTRRGFVTLSLGTAETTREKTYSLYYPSIERAALQPLSALAYAAANAWEALARTDGVDSTRIGIMGHSYGGKWAMFASCLYDKYACAAWGDPGVVFDESKGGYVNYWEPWYLGYYPPPWTDTWRDDGATAGRGLYPRLRREGLDLHELHALMAPRPFLVSGGHADGAERWIALNHAVAVNRLLGFSDRVAMTNRASHDPDPQSNETICDFFERWLGPCPGKGLETNECCAF